MDIPTPVTRPLLLAFLPLCLLLLLCSLSPARGAMDSCYDEEGRAPSRCMPRFQNAAHNRTVLASNVCGSPPEDYCMQTGSTRSCHRCDANADAASSDTTPGHSHGARLLTDFHTDEEPTWWQSQSMFYGIQHPESVNLTLHLGKAFEITYVRLKFYTSRPESFAVYKRTEEGGPWLPYQYYSASCWKTYGRDAKGFVRPGDDERTAVCTDEFSDISPLTGGNVAFSTLEGRPSAYNFDQSAVLQEWVTATDLLVSLNRLNTFGDEFFKDSKVLRSYFYAISDFSVGGRCKCHGHASECVEGEDGRLSCACQHHTAGVDCQQCHPFYQDRPWARATGEHANECLKCNCNGRSEECVFDAEQYRGTGSGGRCVNCRDNTDGPHCGRCRENHYRSSPQEVCQPCRCDNNGSVSLQCDGEGRCPCRASVTGEKCETCLPGFHSLGPSGCRPCDCDLRGSVGDCSLQDGSCYCKANVEGHSCDRCKPGFFNLQQSSPAGCQSCFCFGHSLACSSSNQHAAVNVTSDFMEDQDGWLGEFSGGQDYPLLWKEGEVYLLPLTEEDIGFYKAPEKFLGDQLLSHGQLLSVTFTSETPDLLPGRVTVLLEGGSGTSLSAELVPQAPPDHQAGLAPRYAFTVRLHEEEERLKPSPSAFELQHLLYNLTALRISNAGGHNYTSQLSGVTLASAASSPGPAHPHPAAPWVEVCSCPLGLEGQFCERCAPGFTREAPGGGPRVPCVPCNCHRHGPCHPETGVCECSHFTTGPTCGRCLDGYYGNALIGASDDCQGCPCPDRTSCAQMAETGAVVCTNCPTGQRGTRCQMCEDGYHGDPLGQQAGAAARPCVACGCSGNVDPNAVGVCDHVTGRCLKCLGHTEGDHCQRCQRGYYGDALEEGTAAGQKCKACSCRAAGTSGPPEECHPQTGSCRCLAHVTGRDCSHCDVGFFNLQRGTGCEGCSCDPMGSSSEACHPVTGQCVCRAGVEARSCDACRPGFFGFSSRGCRACNCDPMGSVSMQCHGNGTCYCRHGFVGYKCDKCELNYYHNRASHQCEECPVCYGLVNEQAEKLRARLQDLEKLLARFDCRGRSGRQYRTALEYRAGDRPEREDHQGEDTLPNALEDFLAMQEARDAFIKQFSMLEMSTHTLAAQLYGVTSALNCSVSMAEEEEEERKRKDGGSSRRVCQTLSESVFVVRTAQTQLKRATLDLDNMIIPFELPSGQNKWNSMVNDSEALMKSHRELAGHMEVVARRALRASNQTLGLLMVLLQDQRTEEDISSLTEQLAGMKRLKENLTAQVNETLANQLALKEESAEHQVALGDLTSSLRQLGLTAPSSPSPDADQAETPGAHHATEGAGLLNRTAELALHVQTKEELVSKIREEMGSLMQTAGEKLEMVDGIHELTAHAQGAKVMALSSVVAGKEAEAEVISMRRELEDMQREWPRRQAQTRAAMKKERPLGEKVLGDVRRRVKQVEKMLRSALENSSLPDASAKEAERHAQAAVKESKATLTQAKHTRTASAQLGSRTDSTLRQLSQQERLAARHVHSQVTSEPEVSLAYVKNDIEAAKLQLEAYSLTLTELLGKIDGRVPLERFERLLNDTAGRLSMLRGSVESPALSGKIQRLRSASEEQRSRMSLLERDLQEIRDERDSLQDIALNLPKSCPQATGQA